MSESVSSRGNFLFVRTAQEFERRVSELISESVNEKEVKKRRIRTEHKVATSADLGYLFGVENLTYPCHILVAGVKVYSYEAEVVVSFDWVIVTRKAAASLLQEFVKGKP